MHMADALISPAVGGVMLAATLGVAAYSIKKTAANEFEDKKIPMMGVMGAFVFAAQMINFTIPGTGSSGHIGGGILLSALLGPTAGFLTMMAVLLIQALFFADGGLLAYGCNVINMGFFACFVAFPLIYRTILKKGVTGKRIAWASILSVVVGLQLGAFGVVLETLISGKTELPFSTFVLLMQPIHLAIGLVEGVITAAILTFVHQMRPELLDHNTAKTGKLSARKLVLVFAIAAVLIGGAVSWFASSNPDGLEWAMERTAGTAELSAQGGAYEAAADIQQSTAFLPDYGFKTGGENAQAEQAQPSTPVNAGTSVAGIVGGVLTLAIAAAAGFLIHLSKRRKNKAAAQ